MSKLYKKYVSLKIKNSKQLYLFKSGIFYIFLDEDAKLVSSILNLKLTNLNSMVVKCGFPTSKLDKYTNLMKSANLSFQIVDLSDNVSYLPEQYIFNDKVNKLLQKIASTSSNDLSISAAYDFINEIVLECQILLGDIQHGKKEQIGMQ